MAWGGGGLGEISAGVVMRYRGGSGRGTWPFGEEEPAWSARGGCPER